MEEFALIKSRVNLDRVNLGIALISDLKVYQEGLISMIMHNSCILCTFSTFAQKISKGWGWNFTWNFGKAIHT